MVEARMDFLQTSNRSYAVDGYQRKSWQFDVKWWLFYALYHLYSLPNTELKDFNRRCGLHSVDCLAGLDAQMLTLVGELTDIKFVQQNQSQLICFCISPKWFCNPLKDYFLSAGGSR